jgi:hypothetical protein
MSESMLIAYRHDAHKFTGQSHDDAPVMVDGIVVNQSVPRGADDDAAALSRPRQTGTQTVATHCDHHRLSLLTGETVFGSRGHSSATVECDVRDLLVVESAETAHERWLASDVAAAFNESVYHPYTSLKYHTLLVAALLDNYRAGHGFADLRLVGDSAGEITPFRTVFDGNRFALRIDADDRRRPAARLGSHPWRSWASTWNRLMAHPLDTDHDKYDMVLDANLRRIGAWSTALQYLEDFECWIDNPDETGW